VPDEKADRTRSVNAGEKVIHFSRAKPAPVIQ
jgi:hypothetical protein